MTVDDIVTACTGYDCKRWKASPGVDIYPPQDPCDYRCIVWIRPSGFGWRVDVERRSAFYWEVERSVVVDTPEEVRSLVGEVFANDETAKATADREAGAA